MPNTKLRTGRKENIFDKRHRELSKRLLLLRKEVGLTQTDLAQRLKRSKQWVSAYETNSKSMNFVEVIDILSVLTDDQGEEFISCYHREVIRGEKESNVALENSPVQQPNFINPFLDDIIGKHRDKPWKYEHPGLIKMNLDPWFHFPKLNTAIFHVILDIEPWVLGFWLENLDKPEIIDMKWAIKCLDIMHEIGEQEVRKGTKEYGNFHSFLKTQKGFRQRFFDGSQNLIYQLIGKKKKEFGLKYEEHMRKLKKNQH